MVTIRLASAEDLARLEEIENSADVVLVGFLEASNWPPAPDAASRAWLGGFVLVAVVDGQPVGFAHVLEIDGGAHLEQLSVIPARARQGLGRLLVESAKDEAARRGYGSITLRTYADVPWNTPFYASCGFVESEARTAFQRSLIPAETRAGIDRYGRRIQMTAALIPVD
jgi:GNAT superfamily N-acetyltransferase